MNKPEPDLVRDMRQSFDLTGAAPAGNSLVSKAKVQRVKVFKSGNSLAVRMPKALGLEAGMELEVTVQPDGALVLRKPAPLKRGLDISGFWGKAPGLKLAPRRDFDERPSTIAAREAARKAAGETPSDT
ncbi:AbrB/MazE/SpoVT family DNA-binding domain-containing protein [Novosphingobium sp. B 225]|uniref:AbrB/MazE/SpoVT family DNA-binding domain-containing protein n=1 Tax=Novosphingobium sp. B 225 TaxID=1961849 RepID=UPI0020CECAA5|nr:AbrB/MazE/SpoVT family DNA-binding domain-containing protein [Novosphingobium sp. B 225]